MIVTGEIGGAMWKGKIDCLNLEEKYFVDIKTTKDMHEKKWDERLNRKANFIERFGYVLQMAVYCELLRQQYDKIFFLSLQLFRNKHLVKQNSSLLVKKNDLRIRRIKRKHRAYCAS